MAKCEKCGKEFDSLSVNIFNLDGSDCFYPRAIGECQEHAVYVDVEPNWTGNDLSNEEAVETIRCPHCGKFPFRSEEIKTVELIRIVMFQEATHE